MDLPGLSSALRSIFLSNIPSPTPEQVSECTAMGNDMAAAIQVFVQTATITYSAGLVAPGGGGPVTGVFVHTIT